MSPALLLLLALWPHFVFPYNVDVARPVVHEDPFSGPSNYFGYSVSLGSEGTANTPSSLFVGAPNAADGQGEVYRCTVSSSGKQQPSPCQKLKINDKILRRGWLGASMATYGTSRLVVCAPRTLLSARVYPRLGRPFDFFHLTGGCYYTSNSKDNATLYSEYSVLPSEEAYKNIRGFSVSYAASKGNRLHRNTYDGIIGQPGINSVEILRELEYRVETKSNQINDNLGYSVSSGYSFPSHDLSYVAGAPSYLQKGAVHIFQLPTAANRRSVQRLFFIKGSVLGEYFGASLATGDFDGDGREDLAIGAPHWGTINVGRVYIYHSNSADTHELGQTLQGKVENGQFGYTLASADLDRDGYADLIVSAPWEGSGVVRIYYGRSDFKIENPSAQIIQLIEPSVFRRNLQIQRFGFSLSRPVDVDGNGYPDLGIGAYKSGHAVVLRSRAVIDTEIDLFAIPSTLQISDDHFVVNLCGTYHGKEAPESQELSFDMLVDAKHNRAKNGARKKLNGSFFRGKNTCLKTTISLITHEGRNNVDPIEITVTHSIKEGTDESKIDAVLSRDSSGYSVLRTVPINTKCKNFTACNAHLYVDAGFGDSGQDDEWVVGSEDVSLYVTVRNEDEPAYDTRITIETPALGIRLRKPVEFCTTSANILSLTCNAGNPLEKGKPKSFKFDFDMSDVDTRSANSTVLIFNVTKRTRSVDKEAAHSTRILKLNTKHMAHVALSGVTHKKHIDYGRIVEKSKVPLRHVYQVHKSGPSPITEAYLTIDVPTSMTGRNDSFLNISDPKLTDSYGVSRNCHIVDAEPIDRLLRRKRHGNSDSGETSATSDSKSANKIPKPGSKEASNDPKAEANVEDRTTERTIYLNCSTEGVSCTRLTCNFGRSKAHDGVESIVLDMTFDATTFSISDEDSVTIKIHTNASVDIKWPLISDSAEIRNWTASASTMLHNIPELKEVAKWILPSSIILGILLVFVVALILLKVGFFNRFKKLEIAKAKEQKLLLESNKADNVEEVDQDANGDGDDAQRST